ncbi:unnamed protein product [Brachionus calyciflorus]|uniref:Uncharacterized protein n=1 Tax=Brachionus calyciflorus TaxID=104777 RepID=A0A814IKJ9_9BILA|nr:unnamed protein product [Brachionus calyciflorus]
MVGLARLDCISNLGSNTEYSTSKILSITENKESSFSKINPLYLNYNKKEIKDSRAPNLNLDKNSYIKVYSSQELNFDDIPKTNESSNLVIVKGLGHNVLHSDLAALKNGLKLNDSLKNKENPKQGGNDLDCGVFVCLYAKNVVFDLNFNFNQGDITSSRQCFANLYEVDEILNTGLFEVACFSETKLDETIPNSFYSNNYYNKIRLDRNRHGVGLIIFIKNGIKMIRTILHSNIELIYNQLKIKNQNINLIYGYRSPYEVFADIKDNKINYNSI